MSHEVNWKIFFPSPSGTSKTLYSTNMALSSSPGISAVQLVRTVGHTTTNHLIPALCTSSPQTLPMNNSCLTNAVHLNNVSVVSPVNVHINTRTSAPSPTALKLATVAASMDRVPKVTPSSAISSIARCVCLCVCVYFKYHSVSFCWLRSCGRKRLPFFSFTAQAVDNLSTDWLAFQQILNICLV